MGSGIRCCLLLLSAAEREGVEPLRPRPWSQERPTLINIDNGLLLLLECQKPNPSDIGQGRLSALPRGLVAGGWAVLISALAKRDMGERRIVPYPVPWDRVSAQ